MKYCREILIQGKNISIKCPTQDNLKFIKKLWEDKATMDIVGGPLAMSDEQYEKWFKEYVVKNPNTFYCLIFNAEDIPIGEISYQLIDNKKGIAMFNMKIHAEHRRKGYARGAMINFLNYAFNVQKLSIMCDEIGIDNVVSQNLFISFGFEHKKDKSEHFWTEITKKKFNLLYLEKVSSHYVQI